MLEIQLADRRVKYGKEGQISGDRFSFGYKTEYENIKLGSVSDFTPKWVERISVQGLFP